MSWLPSFPRLALQGWVLFLLIALCTGAGVIAIAAIAADEGAMAGWYGAWLVMAGV